MHRVPLLALALVVAACAPVTASIEQPGTIDDPVDGPTDGPRAASCAEGPTDLSGLETVPVTVFYEGQLRYQDGPVDDATVVEDTPIQREWSTVASRWAPQGADFGNLDDDRRSAGHGVLLAAYRSSTCGMEVRDVEAWSIGDDAGTTYVELTVYDSSGGCEEVCDMEMWAGAAVALPIADSTSPGPVIGCVHVEDECD